MTPIALVGSFSPEEQTLWLSTLRQAMPQETILPFAELSSPQKLAVDIAIVANPDVDEVAQLSNIKWIQSLWAGVEKLVPLFAPTQLPLVRLIDPALANAMAETALTWVLYLHKDMHRYRLQQTQHQWRSYPARSTSRCQVGILGLGELGTAVARQLQALNFSVTGWSRHEKSELTVPTVIGDDGLADLLSRSDILICLLPLTDQTRGLLNQESLAQLKPGASLLNFARGPIVEEKALLDALNNQRIAHAVLDVFDREPLPADHPYWSHPSVTVLPHVSAQTNPETASVIVADNIRRYRDSGTIPASVSYQHGY